MKKIEIPKYTLGEEITNAITHGIGALLAVAALVLTVVYSSIHGNPYAIVASAIYGFTIILLYVMSTIYHSLKINRAKKVFRVIDHCSIYLLIAGTYTPYTLVTLNGAVGWVLFGIVWGCAIIGIILNILDMKKFKKASMALYLIMGWAVIFTLKPLLENIALPGFLLLLGGGIVYTIGAILYGVGKKKKYIHSVFHLFVVAASVLQFLSIFFYVI